MSSATTARTAKPLQPATVAATIPAYMLELELHDRGFGNTRDLTPRDEEIDLSDDDADDILSSIRR